MAVFLDFFDLLDALDLLYTSAMSAFQILRQDEIAHMRTAGDILKRCLEHLSRSVQPGMTTEHIDGLAEEFITSHTGATPAFKGYNGFPKTICASINDECVHGIPGKRVLKDGDIVSLDCGVIVGGMYTDACVTVPVGTVKADVLQFLQRSKDALEAAVAIVAPGVRVGDISATIQEAVERHGYSCVNGLTGHGVGSTLHVFPDIPNTGRKGTGPALPKHIAIAIEPITAMGKPQIRDGSDGWTISTADGSFSAHFEHTILVTPDGHEVLA